MLYLISPAKRLNFDNVRSSLKQTDPLLKPKTEVLIHALQKMSEGEIKELMGLSDKLAELNHGRYQNFETNPANHAVYAFDGDTYTGLDATSLSEDDIAYAQDHLGILSGLYGYLRPKDSIRPYRLEMGTSLAVNGHGNLYEFWGEQITDTVNAQIKKSGAKAVLNLASNEYIKAIDKNKLDAAFHDIDFKEMKNGKPKTIGIHAKKARGMMARFLIQNRIEDPAEIKTFDWSGYEYKQDMSDVKTHVFVS